VWCSVVQFEETPLPPSTNLCEETTDQLCCSALQGVAVSCRVCGVSVCVCTCACVSVSVRVCVCVCVCVYTFAYIYTCNCV